MLVVASAQKQSSILLPTNVSIVPAAKLTLHKNFEEIKPMFKFSAPFLRNYHETLGVMCKLEHKLIQSSQRIVRFRLGTVQYVDKLEGK